MESNPFKCKIQFIILTVLYLSRVPAIGMWKTTDRNVLDTFQQHLWKTSQNKTQQAFIYRPLSGSFKIQTMVSRDLKKSQKNLITLRKPIKLYSAGQKSTNLNVKDNKQTLRNRLSSGNTILNKLSPKNVFRTYSSSSVETKNDSTLDYELETLHYPDLKFNLVLKKAEKIIFENLKDKDLKNQLSALNAINMFVRTCNFVDRFIKGGLLSTLLDVLEKPYQKSIWKLVNTYIWPNKPLQTPELLSIQELVLRILISLSKFSDKLRNEMVKNESLKKTLLKIYCIYNQLQSQESGKELKDVVNTRSKVDFKSLLDELFLSLGYKVDEKITLVSPKVKEPDSKEESWTWEKMFSFSSSEDNGSIISIENYLIPVKHTNKVVKQDKNTQLLWIPYYYSSLDPKESLLRNLRINLGHFNNISGLDDLSKFTLKSSKISSKTPYQLGLLAINLSATDNSKVEPENDVQMEIMCNINMEPHHEFSLATVTTRLLDIMKVTTDFRVLNDIFTELWTLLALKSDEVMETLDRGLNLDLLADIVNYSCFEFDDENLLTKPYFPTGLTSKIGLNEKVSNIFDRLTSLKNMLKDHFINSPKGSIPNLLYNFLYPATPECNNISVDLDYINTRIDRTKSERIERFSQNDPEDAKVLQMTLLGFLVDLIYLDGNRSFTKIRDHNRFIDSVKRVRSIVKPPVKLENISEDERHKYRPLIDKRLVLKTIATNVVNQENLNLDYSLFNTYKGLSLNGIDFLNLRMTSWKTQKHCLNEDMGRTFNSNKLLNILGYHEQKTFENRGVRILSIDGGGSKGVVALEILDYLNKQLEKPLHECFDIICGTSTGGLLASLVALEKMEISEIQKLYDSMIKSIFVRDYYPITGTRLLFRHAIYDDTTLKDILKTSLEEIELIDYSVDSTCPKFFCVSTQMDVTPLRPIIWRNYNYHKDIYSLGSKDLTIEDLNKLIEIIGGSCTIRLRDAIKATTSALGYFPLFERNGHLYGDGALYCNNPSVVALIESKLLYPDTPVELLVSVGNGLSQFNPNGSNDPGNCQSDDVTNLVKLYENFMDHGTSNIKKENKNLSIDQLITHLSYAVTTSEMTHSALEFTMPRDVYYRLTPIILNAKIDETNPEVLNKIKDQTKQYLKLSHIQDKFNSIKNIINS
uniref:Patatin-like phospholipase, putative n=1 Tax=Theileria annulata TaxID=5874 RepID=A0A3B0MTH5_THEAN